MKTKTQNKYVLLFCDRCDLLNGVVQNLFQLYPDVEVKMASDVDNMLNKIEQQLPLYILVILSVHHESHINVVKSIRESVSTGDTPVVIYQALPDEAELRKLSPRLK